jgi:starch phosphorylase
VSTRSSTVITGPAEAIRSGLAVGTLQHAVLDNLLCLQGRFPRIASPYDWYMAIAYSVRDRLLARWQSTVRAYQQRDVKIAVYLSAEYLIGPQLGNNLVNLDIQANARAAMEALDQDFDALLALEPEPGLGSGGLGRLAACYLDSLATLEVPAIGYGIHYEFGMFKQEFHDGAQVEVTDKWLQKGNPWEIMHPDTTPYVSFGGHTETYRDEQGLYRARWIPTRRVKGVPCDIPVLGFRVNTCNTLRLWRSEAIESFDFQDFNTGDYYGAVHEKVFSETLSEVLYPNDEPDVGKRLRLGQQYFFVSCSLQHMLSLLDLKNEPIERLPELFAVQMNDTHPSLAVAELMRLLVDERRVPWDDAWDMTRRTLAYTNHTLLPEALETWSLPLFRTLLPRPLEIIYEINRRFLTEVQQRYPGDGARVARMSLIDESGEKRVRMANLATVGSHAVNGVAALHSRLLQQTVLRDFAELWPQRFHNVTNGVTPRRFMVLSNPSLAQLLDETVGEGWVTDLARLKALEARADDRAFHDRWRRVKRANKEVLTRHIRECSGLVVDPAALFDIQVKRIHEYKRQHLNALRIITLYNRLRSDPHFDAPPRCCLFGGKAAPDYFIAKLIIRLINGIAEVVNGDAAVGGRLKVVFLPNFNVKNSQCIYPAADLSEQISTAGTEASGTGNMKFMLNGALTIGTLDGANVEIRAEAGADNFFAFGLTVEQAEQVRREGYRPARELERNPELEEALALIAAGTFSRGDREIFQPLIDNLRNTDPYLVLADYADYLACQERVNTAWQDTEHWTRMSILNTARGGKFSSDRAVREYSDGIWSTKPVRITLDSSLS